MKAEKKEKLLKNLKDWKQWIFTILPIVMVITSVVLMLIEILGVIDDESKFDITKWIITFSLFIVSVILISCGRLLELPKEKYKRNKVLIIIRVVLLLAFIGVEVYLSTLLPKLYESKVRAHDLYEEYVAARESGDEQLRDQFWDDWREATRKSSDMSLKLEGIHCVNICVALVASFVLDLLKQKDPDKEDGSSNTDDDKKRSTDVKLL